MKRILCALSSVIKKKKLRKKGINLRNFLEAYDKTTTTV